MNAASSYQRNSLEGASPIGLVVLLYQHGAAGLRRAIAALRAGEVEARTNALHRVLAIVAELKSVLDFEHGGVVARQFAQFYSLAERMILDASCRQDAEPLEELLGQFERIQAAWQQVDSRPVEGRSGPTYSLPGDAGAAGEMRTAWQA